MQPSAAKSIIVICAIAYINIVFLQDINTMFVYNIAMMSTWQASKLPSKFVMSTSWQVSKLPPHVLDCRVPWYTAECHGMQPSATKSIIDICAIAYINIIFLQDINTMFVYNTAMLSSWQVSKLPPKFVMPSSWQVSELPPQVLEQYYLLFFLTFVANLPTHASPPCLFYSSQICVAPMVLILVNTRRVFFKYSEQLAEC
jgi:hypothetical protein